MFSRFQMFVYKSIVMRKAIIEEAQTMGWREGSPEYARFERMMTADLFMMALASLFPASMFGSNLGAPYQQFQQASDFFFASDDDKQKAFYGVLPYPANILQAAAPPIMRIPMSVFGTLLTEDNY